jgi:putative hemolysin
MTFEFLVIILLVLANGFFVISEMSIVSSRKSRLQQLAAEGNKGAKIALDLSNKPDQFLPVAQTGIILIGVVAGAFAVTTIAKPLALRFHQIPQLASYSDFISATIVVLIIVCMIIILGDMAPKRLALSNPEKIASIVASYIKILTRIASPFVFILGAATDLVI